MCGNCKGCASKSGCGMHLITKILVIVGGINWGLVGLGMVLGQGDSYNLVKLLLGSMPMVEGIVYLLVGVAAVLMIFGCKCKTCDVTAETITSTKTTETTSSTPNPTV